MATTMIKCGKCDGRGWLTYHRHIDGGKCFECGGEGRVNGYKVKPVVCDMSQYEDGPLIPSKKIPGLYRQDARRCGFQVFYYEGCEVASFDRHTFNLDKGLPADVAEAIKTYRAMWMEKRAA